MLFKSVILLVFALAAAIDARADEQDRLLNGLLNTPNWLSVTGEQRTRYEYLDNQFRTDRLGNDEITVLRTNLFTRLYLGHWQYGLEIMDSRQFGADDETSLNTGTVNPIDVLQLYAQYNTQNLFEVNSSSYLKAGRFTMDIGSRRLVSRNRFRNTINAFTGAEWQWVSEQDEIRRAFLTMPVQRLPFRFEQLKDNRSKGDRQDTDVLFWGGFYKFSKQSFENNRAEIFYYGLSENDSHDRPTRNRHIQTLGSRVFRNKSPGRYDFEIEGAYQFGNAHATRLPSDTNKLDVSSYFLHAEVGYLYERPWSPRLAFEFDYASGDDDPTDDNFNRFDPLYDGARRSDFGPTGIYGALARTNIISPGLRLELKPKNNLTGFVAHRGFWLASKKDAWVIARVRDPNGDSGRFVAQQTEARIRWDVMQNRLRLETGAAYLFKEKFAKDAPNANPQGDSKFFYTQATFKF